MPSRFIARGLIVILALISLLLIWLAFNPPAVVTVAQWYGLAVEPTVGPTPPPPTILAPRGELPNRHAGLEEWAQYRGEDYAPVGSGFLLGLPNGDVIGVTTAHSVDVSRLARMAFRLPQAREALVICEAFYGLPGQPSAGYNFAMDYVLLKIDRPVEASLVLEPDPRGAPQPGERVVLSGGFGDGNGNPRLFAGTVTTVDDRAVWVQMDETFDPSGLSGSPLLSTHTGQVIGMAIATGRSAPVLIGFHPIGSLVGKAASATQFPALISFQR